MHAFYHFVFFVILLVDACRYAPLPQNPAPIPT